MDGNNNNNQTFLRKKKKRSKTFSKKSKNASAVDKSPFKFKCYLTDTEEKNLPVYAIKFNQHIVDRYIFAATVGNQALVFECFDEEEEEIHVKVVEGQEEIPVEYEEDQEENPGIKLMTVYQTSDSLFSLDWSYDTRHGDDPILAFAGGNGTIRVVGISQKTDVVLNSHTGPVNDLKFHPILPYILISAAADHTLHLSNVYTAVTVAVFSGKFHCSEVLTAAFNDTGTLLASGSMDRSVLIWNTETDELKKHIYRSANVREGCTFKPLCIYEYEFIARDFQTNYIDSLLWFGQDILISRSSNGDVVMWKPGTLHDESLNLKSKSITTIKLLKPTCIEKERIWFMRMELDPTKKYLVLGNVYGKVEVWDLGSNSIHSIKKSFISHQKCNQAVRMTSFSHDGRILVFGCEDGKIFRFDKKTF